MTKNVYKIPSEALALTKKYHEACAHLLSEKARMEAEYQASMLAGLAKVQDAKKLACSAAAALLGINLGPEDLYDIDVSYLDSLGIAMLQHIPADEKPNPVAQKSTDIN